MRRVLALLLVTVMGALVGCSGQKDTKTPEAPAAPSQGEKPAAKKDQIVRINIGTDPETLDPGVSTGIPEANVELNLFEGLMRLDKDGRPIPGMAAAPPEVKDNGTTYIFKLRDAKWSNGDPVTAEDFVWSWKRALDPYTASEYAYQLWYIKGGEALSSVKLKTKGADGKEVDRPEAEVKAEIKKLSDALGVKALDAKTLEVKLEAPTPYFPAVAAFHTLFPVHRKSLESNPKDWFRKPETMVTNGAFKLQSWTPKDKVILVKNPDYYDAAKVKLDKIEYYLIEQESTATTMFESGQLDIVESGVSTTELDRLKKEKPNELKILPDLGTYYYRFNVTKPPMNDVKVRKALTMAIDRKAIVENITKAGQVPAMAFVPSGLPDASGEFRKNGGDFFKDNDVAAAKQLLADAGFPDGKGFPKLSILYNTNEAHKRIAEAIQEMWKKNLGIEVELVNQEWAVYLANQSSLNYMVSRAGWLGDYVDPMTFVDMFVTAGGNNQTGWSNKTYDDLVKQAKSTGDQTVRMKAMHDAEKVLMDEMPIMPIYFYVRVRLISPKVKGWSEPLTSGMNLREAYVE